MKNSTAPSGNVAWKNMKELDVGDLNEIIPCLCIFEFSEQSGFQPGLNGDDNLYTRNGFVNEPPH